MREKPESVDFPNAASQGAKIGSISQPSPTGNPATIGCVYSCTGAFSFALYVVSDKHETVSLTVIMAGTTQPTPPEKGEEFTIGTGADAKKYRCTDCSVEWSNEDAAKISISGRTYPSVTAST